MRLLPALSLFLLFDLRDRFDSLVVELFGALFDLRDRFASLVVELFGALTFPVLRSRDRLNDLWISSSDLVIPVSFSIPTDPSRGLSCTVDDTLCNRLSCIL